jgi:hypothetical protein
VVTASPQARLARDHYHPPTGGRVAATISLDGALTQAWETIADHHEGGG